MIEYLGTLGECSDSENSTHLYTLLSQRFLGVLLVQGYLASQVLH